MSDEAVLRTYALVAFPKNMDESDAKRLVAQLMPEVHIVAVETVEGEVDGAEPVIYWP